MGETLGKVGELMNFGLWEVPSFPYRPAPVLDESPLSRFFRRAQANCFSEEWVFFRDAGFRNQGSWTDPSVMDRIQAEYGSDEDRLFEWRRGLDGEIEIRVGTAWAPSKHVDFRGVAVCPRCLEEGAYRRVLWDVSCFLCCPRHDLWLTDSCRDCGGSVDLLISGISECAHGHDFRRFAGNRAPDHVVEFHRRLEEAAGLGHGGGDGRGNRFQDSLSALSFFDLLSLGLVLGPHAATRDLLEAPVGKPRSEIRRAIEGAASVLADWPNGFRQSILTDVRKAGRNGALSVHWRSSAIHDAVNERLVGPQFDPVRAEFEAMRKELWARYDAAVGKTSADNEAAGEDLIGLTDAAHLLGLDRSNTKRLMLAGLFSPVTDYDKREGANWLFHKDSIEALDQVFVDAMQAPSATGYCIGMPLDSAWSAFRAWNDALPGLIRAVAAGRIPVVGIDPKKRGLKRFVLDFRAMADFLLEGRAADERIEWRKAAALLGLKKGVCDWLAAQGVLRPEGKHPWVTCPAGDVQRAAEEIVVLRRVVFGTETGLTERDREPGRLGCRPLGQPANGCPVFLYDRATLERLVALKRDGDPDGGQGAEGL